MEQGIRLFIRSFREGSLQLWRNKFLSLSTIFLGSLIILLLNFVFGIEYYADYSLQKLEQKADFTVILSENYSVFDFDALENDLKLFQVTTNIIPAEIKEGVLIPDRLYIQFEQLKEVGAVFDILKHDRYNSVLGEWDGEGEQEFVEIIDQLLRIRETVNRVGFWMTIIFIIGGSFLIINTFRMVLFSRKDEIFIARLVGAEHRFISWPFLFEGMLIGFFSCVLGILAFVFALREVYFLPGGDIFVYLFDAGIFSYELYIAGAVGILGALIAVRKYLFGKFS